MTNYTVAKIAYNNYNYKSIYEWGTSVTLVPHDDEEKQENGEYKFVGFYFEVYLDNPKTYYCSSVALTLEEAEKSAFDKYQSYLNCIGHEFERRNYTNGVGFCKYCNLFKSKAFMPSTLCSICQTPTQFCSDSNEKYYCENHEIYNKDEKYLKGKIELELFKKRMKKINENPDENEKFKEKLKNVMQTIGSSMNN